MKKAILTLVLLLPITLVMTGCDKNQEMTIQNSVNTGPNSIKIMDIPEEETVDDSQLVTDEEVTNTATTTDEVADNKLATSTENLLADIDGVILKTNFGDIKIKFYKQESPKTVANFIKLTESGFYSGVKFHRVIKDFMIQSGDPNSKDDDWSNDGYGGPGYQFADEINDHSLVRGSIAMANSGANTNGSQFFIVTAESTPWLDGKHTNFGEVVEGLDTVMKIQEVAVNENDHPLEEVVINSIELVKNESAETEK